MITQKTQEQLRQEIAGFCEASTVAQVAKDIVVSRQYLYDILKGTRTISKKVAKFFGYTVETTPPTRIYKKIENNQSVSV